MYADLLDTIQVPQPCKADWDSMIGNDQARFCEHCSLTVHDLSQMTRKRARRLVAKSNGRLCIRYQRQPDGSLITRVTPQRLFQIGRRASKIAAGAFSASLSLSSAIASPSMERPMSQRSPVFAQQDPSRQVYTASSIVGIITDANGMAIPGATVTLNSTLSIGFFTSSNSEGEFRFEGIEPGSYNLRIAAVGFEPRDWPLYIGANTTRRVDQRPEVATIREEVEIQGEPPITLSENVSGAMVSVREPSHPLVKAAQDDDFLNVLAVLTRENVNVRDKATGDTALEHAVRNGNREMLQALISVGADVNSRNISKETPLMMLTEEATADMVLGSDSCRSKTGPER